MLKKYLMGFCLGLSTLSADVVESFTIDYGKFPTIASYGTLDPAGWTFGGQAFNYAPELLAFFALIKQLHQIEVCVETGTFQGSTTRSFSTIFNEVHTIEAQMDAYLTAKDWLKASPNVICHFGNSERVLNDILPYLEDKRILFYLDTQGNGNWSLLDELKAISKTHKDNCVIVIDDFKVPGRTDIPYDVYGHHECSIEYVKGQLDQVLSAYTIVYVIPNQVSSRAKFVAIPKEWRVQP